MSKINDLLTKVTQKKNLSRQEAYYMAEEIIHLRLSNEMIAAVLIALKTKGETAQELSGFADVLKEHAIKPNTEATGLIDVCGTGGDRLKTFNISTTVAFVLAGCGLTVAKHGNRSVSSLSGSADVLAHLGLSLDKQPENLGKQLERIKISFLFAPACHPLLKGIMPLRKALGVPTIFNLIGPLSNPLPLSFQIIGVYSQAHLDPMIHCMKQLGIKGGAVIHGFGGLDELSLEGPNQVILLRDGTFSERVLDATEFGLDIASNHALACSSVDESAAMMIQALKGHAGPALDVVLFNAALALFVSNTVPSIEEGITLARKSIVEGNALTALNQLLEGGKCNDCTP